MSDKYFLVLGGCGFIGRNLVHHLVCKYPNSKIRVVDKIIPQLAYMNKLHEASFSNPRVEFISANLIVKGSREKVFQSEQPFDYVINCAGETRFGLTEVIYQEGIIDLGLECAKLAAEYGVKRFVEISSGSIRVKGNSKGGDDIKPCNTVAKYKLMLEEELSKVSGLNYTILRPALVYGLADKKSITPRMVIAVIYRYLEETMKLLGGSDLKMYTIHVKDLCEAICFILDRDDTISQTYNVVDDGYTTQGKIGSFLKELFHVSVEYLNDFFTSMYKISTDNIVEEINEKHLKPWSDICAVNNITNTPLSPFLYREDLCFDDICLDGMKLKSLGFRLKHPEITINLLQEIIDDYKMMGLFPLIYLH